MPPNIPGKKSISVIISDDLYEAVKTWAEMKEWSLSKAARRLIEIGFDTEMGTPKATQPTKGKKPAKGKQ
jgi:hypothetical protein